MKFSASFPFFPFLFLLFFSIAMAEEFESNSKLKEEALPSIHQPTIVSEGVDAARYGHSLAMKPPAKGEWPDVVGMTVEEAGQKIREDMPMVIFQVVLPNCFVTMDYNTKRVRLYVDSSGKVVRPAKIG